MVYELEWVRPDGNFKYVDKTRTDIIVLKNSGNLSDEFYRYSKSFHLAGDELIHYLLTKANRNIAKLDTWFFAIGYLYRQSLELILKATIFRYVTDNAEQKVVIGKVRHDLNECFMLILEKLPAYEVEVVSDDLDWVRTYFQDITLLDRESDMFRYPFNRKMEVVFRKQTHISLKAMKQNMNTAYKIIEDILTKGCPFIGDYRMFQPKFIISGGGYYEQSVVGYQFSEHDFYPYFKSYEESANCLKDIIIGTKNYNLFLPMCYLFRNAIELGLKRILLEDCEIKYDNALAIMRDKKHSVLGLWNKIKDEISEKSNAPKSDTTMEDVDKYIIQLHDFDSCSSKFRYPVGKDLKFHFPREVKLSVENIAKCFNELCTFLDCVDGMLSEIKSINAEMQAEWEAEMRSYMSDYY